MLQTKAVFMRKEPTIEATDCVIENVIRLSGAKFDSFSRNLMADWDFIRDNPIDRSYDSEGRCHCLLVVGEGRRDGILVNPEGGNYARYSALLPNAEDFLTAGQYPALAALNQKLTVIVDYIAGQIGADAYVDTNGRLRSTVDLESLDAKFDIELMRNGTLLNTVFNMLDQKHEITDWEVDKNELLIYSTPEPAADLTDPAVTKTDMYAYGYGWDGMIPQDKDRALELFDRGHQIYRLYENNAEGAIDARSEIDSYDGMFGVEDPAWVEPEQTPALEVFILNREKNDKGEPSGEWLTLPVLPGDLCNLFKRIGIDRPSEGAFTITAVRVPDDYIRDHVSKYDSLDELNMLASFLSNIEDFERDKVQAILASGVADIGSGTAALINALCAENFDAFEMIDAKDAESLAHYYHAENNEKPDDVSFEEYGRQCVKEEGGVFTEWGYIKFKHKELLPEYTGIVPAESQITGMALHALRLEKPERGSAEKPSVMKAIRDAQNSPKPPRKDKTPEKKKEGPEL